MRALLGIAIAAVVIITVWSTNFTVATHAAASMAPGDMMMTTTNLPNEQFDAF
jgi:hypothetical protein